MTPTVADKNNAPEDQDSAPPAPDYGINFRDLPDQLKKALIAGTTDAQSTEKYIRREEVLQDAQLRFYDVGIQHVYLNRGWNWTMATPGGSYATGNGTSDTFGEYLDDYPISPAYAQIIRAKLSEHDPSVDWQPDDPNEPSDIESAKAGEALRHDFDRNNDIKLLQQQIIYHFQMGGRAVAWTRTEDSPSRFGDVSGNTPRRSTTTIYGSIESKVPMFASCVEDFPYVVLYDDPDIKDAKTKYWWIEKDISAGQMCLEENAYERIARLGIIQSSTGRRYDWNIGDSMSHLISRGHVWLRLSMFESMKAELEHPDPSDVDEDGNVITVREKIARLYPDGVHVCFVGQEYAESWNQSMDDCIGVKHAYIGKGQSRMPMMRPMVVVQDRFNQMMNLIAESTDYRVPSTWISCGPVEYAAIQKQDSKPGAFRNLKEIPAGAKVSDMVYREDDYAIPASLMQFLEFMQAALPQFMLSAPPSMWGAAQADNKLMDVEEPIPTPNGFIRNGDLQNGAFVLGEDGRVHQILKAHPAEIVDAYRVTFDDGTDVCVHGGHLWTTYTRAERVSKYKKTSDYRARQRKNRKRRGTGLFPQQVKRNEDRGGDNYTPKPQNGKVRTTEEIAASLFVQIGTTGPCANHGIPICAPIELAEADLPIDPYCLGAWLGDGSMNGGSHFTAADKDGPDVLRHFEAAGYKYKRLKSPNDWTIEGLTIDLKAAGLLRNKHIPHEYLWASQSQRLALLQGLMDTDGGISANGRAIFGNANRGLSEGVYHLAASLGLKPFISTIQVKLNGVECAPSHRVEWAGTLPIFRLRRKLAKLKATYKANTKWRYITSITPCGPMQMRCLTTSNPTGLYLFGKNFNVTHNTATGYQLAASQANGIQGAIWDMQVALFATIYYQNCIAVANDEKYPDQIVIPNLKGRRSVVDKASLTKGKFRCFPDKDSGFPESTASMRQAWERTVMMLAPTPMGMQIFASPDNIAEYVRVSGVKLTVPEAISRDKQLREIEILLAQPPIITDPAALQALQDGADIPTILKAINAAVQAQQQQFQAIVQQTQVTHAAASIASQATGQPAPAMPPPPPPPDPAEIAHSSVAIWPSDFHVYEAAKCKDYLSSDQCNTELTIGRPDISDGGESKPNISGVLNVVLHWMEHTAAAALETPPISGPLPAIGSPPKMPAQPAGS